MPAWLVCGVAVLAPASPALGADKPDTQKLADLDRIVKAEHPGLLVSFYCVGRFTQRDTDEYAVGATRGNDGKTGSYFVSTGDGRLVKLSDFTGGLDLQCMTNDEARKLNPVIRESGLHGRIPDSHPYGTVCGFVEATAATCWGYDEKRKIFTAAGGWVT